MLSERGQAKVRFSPDSIAKFQPSVPFNSLKIKIWGIESQFRYLPFVSTEFKNLRRQFNRPKFFLQMTAFWFSHISRRLKPSPFSYVLTHSLSDPVVLLSRLNSTLTESFLKHPTQPRSAQTTFGFSSNHLIEDYQFPKKVYHYNPSTHIASICTSSGGVDGENSDRKKHDTEKGLSNQISWIDVYFPKSVRPYAHLARLDKPIGTWLLAWPCMWSITLAAPPGNLPDLKMMFLFGSGALLLRGAGCTMNDLWDRDIDTKVERTKLRPVASGVLTPFQGISFLGAQLFLGLGILLQMNDYSRILGASSLLLVFSYPLMKRVTFWPQAFLGLTFNWGALLGWSAIQGNLDPTIVLPLYSAGVFWTLVYDTIYAHQDKEDDLKVGVKSTALRFGDLTKNWVSGFGVVSISSLALSGYNADIGWPFYPFLMAASGQMAWQILTVDLSSHEDCNRKFVSNKWFGAFVFGGILLGKLAS